MKKKRIFCVLFSILVIIYMFWVSSKTVPNDTFFSIACGRKYLSGDLSKTDTLTWHENLNFTNSRWLYDTMLTKIYEIANFDGIYLMVCIFAACEGIIFFAAAYKISKRIIFSFLATIVCMFLNGGQFVSRAHEVSILMFFITFLLLEKLRKKDNKFYIILLFLISILVANMHGTIFPILLVIYLPYFAEFIINIIMKKLDVKSNKYIIENIRIKYIFISFILTIIAGFCTINGLDTYTYIIKALNGASYDFSLEMKSLNIIEHAGFYLILMLAIAVIGFSKTKVRITDIFFILGFGLIALNNVRGLYYYQLIGGMCLIRMISTFLDTYEINFNFVDYENTIFKYIIFVFVYLIVLFLFIGMIFEKMASSDYIDEESYPVDAVRYIKNNLDINQIKIYNGYDFGSYLEYEGIKAFIDSRAEMFTPSFNENCNILSDWYSTFLLQDDYNDLQEEYGFTHILIYVSEDLNAVLKLDSNWKNIYQDDFFVLYEHVN